MITLGEFARRMLAMPFADFRPPRDALRAYRIGTAEIHTMILYREGQFQLEYITCSPRPGSSSIVPEHCHPNVDSIDVFVHGQLGPLSGLVACPYAGKKRVAHGVYHGAMVGEAGAAMLCIQHWLNDEEPSSIALDWCGPDHHEVRAVRLA